MVNERRQYNRLFWNLSCLASYEKDHYTLYLHWFYIRALVILIL